MASSLLKKTNKNPRAQPVETGAFAIAEVLLPRAFLRRATCIRKGTVRQGSCVRSRMHEAGQRRCSHGTRRL